MVERFDEMPTDQIRKSLASFQENVAEHEQKLANPERYVSDWPRKDPREQQGILSFWRKDTERNREQAAIARIHLAKHRSHNE